MIPSTGARLTRPQTLVCRKKFGITHVVFQKQLFFAQTIAKKFELFEPSFLCAEFEPERGTFLEEQLNCFELPLDSFPRIDRIDNEMLSFLVVHPNVRNCCVRECADDYCFDEPIFFFIILIYARWKSICG